MPTEDNADVTWACDECRVLHEGASNHEYYVQHAVLHALEHLGHARPANSCAQCNKIRALPDSPTKRDMTLDHLLDLGHQARAVEVPKDESEQQMRARLEKAIYGKSEPAKPPESEALAKVRDIRSIFLKWQDSPAIAANEEMAAIFSLAGELDSLIEADAQRLKERDANIKTLLMQVGNMSRAAEQRDCFKAELAAMTDRAEKAERERDEQARTIDFLTRDRDQALDGRREIQQELAAVKGRLAKLVEAGRIVGRLHNLPGLLNACDEAETGE